MTKIAAKISDYLCSKELIDQSEKEIYTYGYEVILENAVKTFILLILGVVLKKAIVTIIFIIAFTTLRAYCGGYHAKKAWQCDVCTLMLWGGVVWGTPIARGAFTSGRAYLVAAVLLVELIIYLYAPIEHVNNRLTEEKRIRNQRGARSLGILYGILVLVLSTKTINYGVALLMTLLEVAILMIIPSEGRISNE